MSRRGPPPKPRELKLIQGTHRPDREARGAPRPEVKAPTCPAWLGREGKREWKRIVPELLALGLISELDRAALAGYCQSWHRLHEAERALEHAGALTYTTASGQVKPRPEVGIASLALSQIRAFAQEFGMSPAARTRVSARPAAKANPFDDLE